VVVLEERQVETVRLDEAHADELIEQFADGRIAADDLRVELRACLARNAADRHEQRLSRLLRLVESLRQIVVNPISLFFDRLAVIANFLFPLLSRGDAE